MEHTLRCNHLDCRIQLHDQAVVTTCSHIFCLACSDTLGLSDSRGKPRQCPACDAALPNPDDAVVATLNPSEDYKTSVLSGLNPTVILECAGRALSFYCYQTTQEIVYQEWLVKKLVDRHDALNNQVNGIIGNANSQITDLANRLEALQVEYKRLEGKNQQLLDAYNEKAKSQLAYKKLYDQLKQEQFTGHLEVAADHDAEQVLQKAAANSHNQSGYRAAQAVHGRNGSSGTGVKRSNIPQYQHNHTNNRGGVHTAYSAPIATTPSGQRARLPHQLYVPAQPVHNVRQPTPAVRQPLQTIDPNIGGFGTNNSPRYGGMSAGIKVGRAQGLPYNGVIGTGRPSGLSVR